MNRRDFIKQSAACAAAGILLPACAEKPSDLKGDAMPVKVSKDKVLIVYFSRTK